MEFEVLDRREDEGFDRAFREARRSVEAEEELEGENRAYDVFDILHDSRIGSYSFDGSRRYVFGFEDDELVSMGSLRRQQTPEPRDENVLEIYHLVMEEDYRGEGRGRETFERCLEEASELSEELDLDRWYMNVSRHSEPMLHLAEEYGFEEVRETPVSVKYLRDAGL
ncbi:MAG: GNAT family N-acetyltransferase [Candidatus Nanohaloarchaea archaeon]|nr:GNAT family N-acetyltransferase [Candidatus Nanohaloarchaea archaeon]